MKILMVLERDFPPDLRVENEIKSLLSKNHEVILACYSTTKNDSVSDWNGCKVYKKRVSKFIYKSSVGALKFPFYFNFWRRHIKAIVAKENIDAIHIHDLPLAKIGYEISNKLKVNFTLDLHENWPAYLEISKHANTTLGKLLSSNKKWSKYELDFCQKADNVIVVVDEAKSRLIRLGINEEKISVVSNYPELSDFDNLPESSKNENKTILFYAGGIGEHRGLQFIITALPDIIKYNSNIELRIFGQGNYTNTLKELTAQLKLEDHVVFYGQVPYKTVLEELVQATITLIPHVKNKHTDSTIPHKLFQYIYAGKPVLASNCDPIERIINETKGGAVYKWDNPSQAAEKLNWILKNYALYSEKRLKSIISQNYNWNIETEKLGDIYKEIK